MQSDMKLNHLLEIKADFLQTFILKKSPFMSTEKQKHNRDETENKYIKIIIISLMSGEKPSLIPLLLTVELSCVQVSVVCIPVESLCRHTTVPIRKR